MFNTALVFDKDGTPLSWQEFEEKKWNTPGYHIVGRTIIRTWMVSTVWLGINHALWATVPIIFETMIFPRGRRGKSNAQWRYATESQARRGHSDVCRMVRSGWRGETERSIRREDARIKRFLRDAGDALFAEAEE